MNPIDSSICLAIERRVIACELTLGKPALLTVIENGLTPASFSDPLTRRIHEKVLHQHAEGLPFELEFVWEHLDLSPVDRVTLLDMTGANNESLMNIPRLCAELRDLAVRRLLIVLAARLSEAATSNPDDVPGIITDLLAASAGSATGRTWKQICDEATRRAEDMIAGTIHPEDFISWGSPDLDNRFKPMRKGELVIVGARPSVGKSALARGIAATAALGGRVVLFESLEVRADDVVDGMTTGYCGVHFSELAAVPNDLRAKFLATIKKLRAAPLHVCEDRSLAGIIARAQSMHAQDPLDLLIVDYLGLIGDCQPNKGETMAQAVGTVTKALKRLAMEMNIVVICLAQLNRQAANDGNREPRLSDLRDSGDIEQDADRVIFIHRPDECPLTKQGQDTLAKLADLPRYGCALIQAKGRSVGTGYYAVWFTRRLARFEFQSAEPHAKAA